ncbi:MAG TPA: integration host factor subunit beta [Marinagarivorans sp.]
MTRSELIERIADVRQEIQVRDVELAIKMLVEQMAQTVTAGERIEIRGFGSFELHYRPPRRARNPKTGEQVALDAKYAVHFKPGKELREKVNAQLTAIR